MLHQVVVIPPLSSSSNCTFEAAGRVAIEKGAVGILAMANPEEPLRQVSFFMSDLLGFLLSTSGHEHHL
jgi:hypothetical protein